MSKTIVYTGAQTRWPELPVTGKQSVWNPGWIDTREDAEASALLATGLFEQQALPQFGAGSNGSIKNPLDVDSPWYGPGGSGGPAFPYVSQYDVPSSSQAVTPPDIQRMICIDPVDGDDANIGTMAAPKKTLWNTGVGALWTGATTGSVAGDLYLFKRGTTYIHPDTSSAIEVGTGRHIGSYGRLDLPRPILRAVVTNIPYVVGMTQGNNCSVSDVDIDASDASNRSGILVYADGATEAVNRHIRNVRITGVVTTGSTLRAGVRHVNNNAKLQDNRSAPYAAMYDCDVINVEVVGATYNGFHCAGVVGKMVDGKARSVRYYGCVADGCSTGYDGHGFGVFAMGVVRDVIQGYTLASGTTYYLTTAQVFGGASGTGGAAGCTTVPDVELVYQRKVTGGAATYRLRKVTGVSASTVPVGAFWFDNATQRLYVNIGIAMPTTPTVGWNLDACTFSTHGVLFNRCLAKGTKWPQATVVQEGHGFAADDMTSDIEFANCESIDNDGLGISFNRGINNRAINCRLVNNKAGVIGGIGSNALVSGCIGIGAGYLTNSVWGKGLCWINPAIITGDAADSTVVYNNWRLLRYTGTDPTVHLVMGHPDFNAPTVRLEDSVVDPGVGRISGMGGDSTTGINNGGHVLARNLSLASDWRTPVAPQWIGA